MKRRSVRTKLLAVQNWEKLATQAEYRASRLASLCGVTLKSLERFVRQRIGISPQQWLDQLRNFQSAQFALAGKRTKEIAYLLGYKNPSDFCHHFKKTRGISLSEWKQIFGQTRVDQFHVMSSGNNLLSLSSDKSGLEEPQREEISSPKQPLPDN